MIVTMSTVTPGSIHKSQPICKSAIIRKLFVSIGGGGSVHLRSGGPVCGSRQHQIIYEI